MPELPEVETVVRQLRAVLPGSRFWRVVCRDGRQMLPSARVLRELLPGKVIRDIRRLGKYIIFDLSDDLVMVVHLRMTGMLLLKPSERLKKFIRAEFTFSNAKKMYFSDIRRFGRIWLYRSHEFMDRTGLKKLGIDPLLQKVDLDLLEKVYGQTKGTLKSRLLDQTVIAGIGNIYADEICFAAGLHPASRLEKLTKKDLQKLAGAISACLLEGIRHGGTTIADFVGTRGDAGKHQRYLQVYGRSGEPCYRCYALIKKMRLAGRGTHFCLKCQQLKK